VAGAAAPGAAGAPNAGVPNADVVVDVDVRLPKAEVAAGAPKTDVVAGAPNAEVAVGAPNADAPEDGKAPNPAAEAGPGLLEPDWRWAVS
jgi:hypothetical protein